MRSPRRGDPGAPPWAARGRCGRWVADPGSASARRRVVLPVVVALVAQLPLGVWLLVHGVDRAVPFLAGAVVGAAALAASRRWPGPAVVVVGATSIADLLLVPTPPAALLPFLFAVVLACIRGARPWALGTVAAAVVLPVAQLLTAASPLLALRSVGELVLLAVATGIGESIRARGVWMQDRRAAWADRRRIAEEQERVRIARELHDVIAHSLSTISVQAGVGLHLADGRPEAAKEALATIRDVSRTALDEVRGVLGVLRGDESAPRAPEPDLDALAALVAEASGLGLRIALEDGLQPRPAHPVQFALYRIVQESLTNAARHAPGADVTVRLAWEGEAVTATVRSRRGGAPPTVVPGRGITGMRERAELLGGTLDVRRHQDGVELAARIPAARPAEVAG